MANVNHLDSCASCFNDLDLLFLSNMVSCSVVRCTDINPKATELAERTGQQNRVLVQPVVCDLVSI